MNKDDINHQVQAITAKTLEHMFDEADAAARAFHCPATDNLNFRNAKKAIREGVVEQLGKEIDAVSQEGWQPVNDDMPLGQELLVCWAHGVDSASAGHIMTAVPTKLSGRLVWWDRHGRALFVSMVQPTHWMSLERYPVPQQKG